MTYMERIVVVVLKMKPRRHAVRLFSVNKKWSKVRKS